MECTFQTSHIAQPLQRFIGKDRQRTLLRHPSYVIQLGLRHWLFNHYNSFFMKPMYHVDSIMFIRPTLISIYGNRKTGYGTNGFNHLLVILTSQFYFEDIELIRTFLRFLTYHLGCINADSESSRRGFVLIQPPNLIPWGLQQFSHKIMQCNIYSRFSSSISRRKFIHISQNIFQLERIRKLPDDILHFLQESHYTFHCTQLFLQIGRHGCFAITGNSIIFNLHLYIRSCGA